MLELLNVNPSSGEPIYKQLHEQVVRLIVGGQLQVDDVLPSVRQIAEYLAVNPMTVSRAIQQLVDQGGSNAAAAKRQKSRCALRLWHRGRACSNPNSMLCCRRLNS